MIIMAIAQTYQALKSYFSLFESSLKLPQVALDHDLVGASIEFQNE